MTNAYAIYPDSTSTTTVLLAGPAGPSSALRPGQASLYTDLAIQCSKHCPHTLQPLASSTLRAMQHLERRLVHLMA